MFGVFYWFVEPICLFRRVKDKSAPAINIGLALDVFPLDDYHVHYSHLIGPCRDAKNGRLYAVAEFVRRCSILFYVSALTAR